MHRYGINESQIAEGKTSQAWQDLMRFQVQRAQELLRSGAPLGSILGGRIGLEMRLIIAGGERISSKLENVHFDMFNHRPVLRPYDWLIMLLKSAIFKY